MSLTLIWLMSAARVSGEYLRVCRKVQISVHICGSFPRKTKPGSFIVSISAQLCGVTQGAVEPEYEDLYLP